MRRSLWLPPGRLGFHGTLGLLALVLFGVHLLLYRGGVWYGDSYQYLMHADNLLAGRPYAATGYVPSPYGFIAPPAYPVGFPVLIAPVLAVAGPDPRVLAAVAAACLVGSAWAAAALVRGRVPKSGAVAVFGLVGLQPGLLVASQAPLADLPFLLFVTVGLLAADRMVTRPERWAAWAVLAGTACAAAVATRTLGVVLLPALVLPDLVRRRRPSRAAWLAAGVGAGLSALVALLDVGHPVLSGLPADAASGAGYGALVQQDVVQHLTRIPVRIPRQIVAYARASFPLWAVPGADGLKTLLFGLALVPVGVGLVRRVRRGVTAAEAFALLYLLALLPWTFSAPRYLFPLYPLYYGYLVVGAWRLGCAWPPWRRGVVAALVGVVAVSYGSRLGALAVAPVQPVVAASDAAVYRAVREMTPASAVLMTSGDPRTVAYHTGRLASLGPQDPGEWEAYARHLGARYAVVKDPARAGRRRAAFARRSGWRLVARSETAALYRLPAPPC